MRYTVGLFICLIWTISREILCLNLGWVLTRVPMHSLDTITHFLGSVVSRKASRILDKLTASRSSVHIVCCTKQFFNQAHLLAMPKETDKVTYHPPRYPPPKFVFKICHSMLGQWITAKDCKRQESWDVKQPSYLTYTSKGPNTTLICLLLDNTSKNAENTYFDTYILIKVLSHAWDFSAVPKTRDIGYYFSQHHLEQILKCQPSCHRTKPQDRLGLSAWAPARPI
jgi:hypothetical protein